MILTVTQTTLVFVDKRLHRFVTASLGKPWKLLGRGPDTYDCWGFVIAAFASIDIVIPDFTYESESNGTTLINKEARSFVFGDATKTPFSTSLVGLSNSKPEETTHVGVCLNNKIYHCLEKHGVVCNNLDTIHRLFRCVDFWRVYA